MKFLILTQYFPPEIGAPQARLGALARMLVRQGHEVEVVTALPNYPRGAIFPEYRRRWLVSETWQGIDVHRAWIYAAHGAGLGRIANYASFLATSLLALRRARRPDWIVVESPPPSLALAALAAGRVWKAPVIVNVADLWPDTIRALGLMRNRVALKFFDRLERFVYARARLVNAVTEGIRENLIAEKGLPPEKVTMLPNGVDPEIYRPLPPDEILKARLGLAGRKIVLFAGNHGYAHALENVLECARRFDRDNSCVHFLFIGDGSEKRRLVALARSLGLGNVTFLDPVSPEEIPRFLSIAECGLSTLRDIPLFEGNRPAKTASIMACGKPIIFAGRGEGARLIEAAHAGIVVPPENPAALASAIRDLIANPAAARDFGKSARTYAEKNLNWEPLVAAWLGHLRPEPNIKIPCAFAPGEASRDAKVEPVAAISPRISS
jgi:glycosyltransferase involved in cell wall biosynthesis